MAMGGSERVRVYYSCRFEIIREFTSNILAMEVLVDHYFMQLSNIVC
jgi:hypothetical protein